MPGHASIPRVDAGELARVLEEAVRVLDEAREAGRIVLDGVGVRTYNNVWVVEEDGIGERPLAVIGDIHGDYETLSQILSATSGAFRVFVGDYIDRGPPGGQVASLYTVLKLLVEGEPVVPLRGNHEPPEGLRPYPHDYPDSLQALYPGEAGRLYTLSRMVFDRLPHALVIRGRVLVVHGGPPVRGLDAFAEGRIGLVEYLGGDVFPPRLEVLEEVLWNDPLPGGGGEDIPNYSRGVGYKWSERTTRRVLELVGVHLIVRGHEWALDGYKIDHGRVVTVFSRLGPPYPNRQAAFFYCSDHDPSRLRALEGGGIEECIYRIPVGRQGGTLAWG